ncbi:hypothetical protein [Streptomyces sp. NPDC046685]|uniref:hypothetical protein n=1 Tax=Streptomyces sp. NPDC046685 TaxID=3157202 RepID=UPI0033FA9AEA
MPGAVADLMGVSTGGFCAAKLPLQYPKVFRAGVALDPDPLTGDPQVLADPRPRERNSPMWLVEHKTLVRPAGGHNFRTWIGMYPDALGWLSTELAPPGA